MGNDRHKAGLPGRAPAPKGGLARTSFGSERKGHTPATFSDCERLGRILDAIGAAGDAIVISRTSDGGAIALTLLRDSGREKTYPATQADLDYALDWLYSEYCGDSATAE